jgi:PKD repeat protein
VADFGASVVSPGAAQFSDASTHPNAPLDGIAAWAWDFDADGIADATTPSVAHTFPAEEGIFPVTLTVTDTDGLMATITKPIDVGIRNDPPVADFQPTRAVAGEPVIFREHSSDPDGSVVAWAWDFDADGTADETAQGPHHTFPEPGDFPVTFTVRDDRGAPGSITKVVHVCDPTIPLDVNLQGGVGVGLCFAV